MKKIRLIIALTLLALFGFTTVHAQNRPVIKAALSAGFISGITAGFEVNKDSNPYTQSFVNVGFYGGSSASYSGANYELRTYRSKEFYLVFTGGVNLGRIKGAGVLGGDDDFHFFIFPHLTAGLGYETLLGEDVSLFVEWDVGIKPSITNINIGVKF